MGLNRDLNRHTNHKFVSKEGLKMLKTILIGFIKFYQTVLSPLKPPTCRFYPTCSHYGLESVERFGALKGGFLTIVRLLKCHPFHPGGIDKVPDTWQGFKRKSNKVDFH